MLIIITVYYLFKILYALYGWRIAIYFNIVFLLTCFLLKTGTWYCNLSELFSSMLAPPGTKLSPFTRNSSIPTPKTFYLYICLKTCYKLRRPTSVTMFILSQVSYALAAPPPTTTWRPSPVSPTRTGVGAGKFLEDHSIQSEPPLKQVL